MPSRYRVRFDRVWGGEGKGRGIGEVNKETNKTTFKRGNKNAKGKRKECESISKWNISVYEDT